jgi:hypothetical protein
MRKESTPCHVSSRTNVVAQARLWLFVLGWEVVQKVDRGMTWLVGILIVEIE